MSARTYTYQGGRKLDLSYDANHFILRSTRAEVIRNGFRPLHAVSIHSWSVATTADGLQRDLQRARQFAPAYPAYIVMATGTPLRVTDRIFVRFRREVSTAEARQFGERFELAPIERLSSRDFLFRIPTEYDSVDM